MTAVRRLRPEPVRDLFEAPPSWTPPQEFTDFLKARKNPALVPAPSASAPVAEVRVAPAAPGRDFAAELERVQAGDLLVIRERGEHGHHTYRAYERCDAFFHHITIDELTWGRIDTRRLGHLDPYGAEVYQKSLEHSLEAQKVIRQLCPETRRTAGETVPQSGIYDGPGYVLLTVDPEPRYRAARAREVPP